MSNERHHTNLSRHGSRGFSFYPAGSLGLVIEMSIWYRAYKAGFENYTTMQWVFGIVRFLLFWAGYLWLVAVDWRIALGIACLHLQKSILEIEAEAYKRR